MPRASVAHRQRPETSKRYPDRGEEGVVYEKEGKEEHFVIHLEDWMFALSGIPALETL